MIPPEQNDLVQLRDNLNQSFNRDELRALCFDLGIDYDSLPNRYKNDTVQELILLLGRQQRIDELVNRCRVLRPHLSWPDISAETIFSLETSAAFPHHSPQVQLSPREQKERQKQLLLLDKVKKFWVNGVLEKSVADGTLLELGREIHLDAVEQPWHDVVGTAVYDTQSITASSSVLEIYKETGLALLILGAPGSGKTTTLLELARELVTQAELNPTHPIPVKLNLTSWAEKRTALIEWVIEELITKYQIPRKTSRPWLENDELILLLDGLDEVPAKHRAACMEAINQFRQEQGLTGLVVCSRIHEYEAVDTKLKLGGAILLNTLTAEQIDNYLAAAGPQLAALRAAIQEDAILREMAQSPLMLQIMTRAYADTAVEPQQDESNHPPETTDTASNMTTRRQHLFATYMQRMLQRRGQDNRYSNEQTMTWLSWLAQRMSQHNQAVFLIEQIQPSWLPSTAWRWFYVLASRLIGGFVIGVAMWIFSQFGEQDFLQIRFASVEWVASLLQLPAQIRIAGSIIIYNLGLGFVVGVIDGLWFEMQHRQGNDAHLNLRAGHRHRAIVGITVAGLTILPMVFFDPLELAILAGLLEASIFVLTFDYLEYGQNWRSEVRAVEALSWSWKEALKGLIPGSIFGIIFGFTMGQLLNTRAGILTAAPFIIGFFLLGGLRRNKLETKSKPNQGIRLSLRNSLIGSSIFSIALGTFFFITVDLNSALLSFAMGAIMGLLYGGVDVMKHVVLRIGLRLSSLIPLQFAHFLDDAADHIILHKVGGGYIFVHRLLQEYIANHQHAAQTGREETAG